MKTVAAALTLLAIAGAAATTPSDTAAQLRPFVGITGSTGTLAQPYAGGCEVGRDRISAFGAHGGIRRGPLLLQVGLVRSSDRSACLVYQDPFVAENGIFQNEGYTRGHHDHLQVASARIGFSPPFAPHVTAYGGAGWETADNDPLALVGVSLNTPGWLRLIGGAELIYLRATHQRTEHEWRNWVRVRLSVVEQEHRWRSFAAVWAGVELQLVPGR